MTLGVVSALYVPGSAANATSRRCACGDWITAILDDEGVMLAVRSHRTLDTHRRWLAARIADGTYAGEAIFPRRPRPLRVAPVPEPTAAVDVSVGASARERGQALAVRR